MIKFETINETLCRMVEPKPLTEKSLTHYTPCAIRPIKDNTQIGKLNKRTIYSGLSNCDGVYILNERQIGTGSYKNMIYAPWGSAHNFEQFEIIGLPVADGSKEWALYQIRSGKKVVKDGGGELYGGSFYKNRLFYLNGYGCLITKNAKGFIDPCSEEEFLNLDKTGWQLYEPEAPKPLLADAQVGDLCRRRDGKWVQIDRLLSIGGMPWICYEIGGLRYINNGEQLNSKLSELGIIHTEPLAPEGSAEWALQMWKLGNDIRNETGVVLMADYEGEEIMVKHLVDVFPSGWQLYKEPEYPKPKYQVGDWVEVYGKQHLITGRPYIEDNDWLMNNVYGNQEKYHEIDITRKLSHSEVVIHIGCLSGTVVHSVSEDCFLLARVNDPQHRACCIDMSMLDTETRKLVEGLLEAQKEES